MQGYRELGSEGFFLATQPCSRNMVSCLFQRYFKVDIFLCDIFLIATVPDGLVTYIKVFKNGLRFLGGASLATVLDFSQTQGSAGYSKTHCQKEARQIIGTGATP